MYVETHETLVNEICFPKRVLLAYWRFVLFLVTLRGTRIEAERGLVGLATPDNTQKAVVVVP